jgi:hypothetical protein
VAVASDLAMMVSRAQEFLSKLRGSTVTTQAGPQTAY